MNQKSESSNGDGFWSKVKRTLDAMEKSELDYVWDEIKSLRAKTAELERRLGGPSAHHNQDQTLS